MTSLSDLHQAVQTAIASKRLGTPVFVRYQLYNPAKGNAVASRLAQFVGVVRGWLNQPLARIYALGSAKSGQVTLTLECTGGATALITWSSSPAQGSGVDLMLIGNQGALYHDAGTSVLWDEPVNAPAAAVDKNLLNLVEQALQSTQPVLVKKGAGQ